jgi:hypothetical protein
VPAVGLNLFFNVDVQLLARLLDNQLGVLATQFLESGVALQSFLDRGQFLGPDMAGHVFTPHPALEFVVRAGIGRSTRRDIRGQRAFFHALDSADLGQELTSGEGCSHK